MRLLVHTAFDAITYLGNRGIGPCGRGSNKTLLNHLIDESQGQHPIPLDCGMNVIEKQLRSGNAIG